MNAPRKYDLDDPKEFIRLLRESAGYLQTDIQAGYGTDMAGRKFALEGLLLLLKKMESPIDINIIEEGDSIVYRDGRRAKVIGICEKVIDGVNHPADEKILRSARIMTETEGGGGRYYTHRKDGISTLESQGDIISIEKAK